jgi:ABC-2 type transport system permease protein
MTVWWVLVRKYVLDSRWMLLMSASALFGLSWLFVFFTARMERRLQEGLLPGVGSPLRMLRNFGGPDMDFSTAAIEMMLWNHPFVILTLAVWAISRGSAAVAAEVERGTMDLILSRPVSRSLYLATHVQVAIVGLVLIAAAMLVGNQVGTRLNHVETPPAITLLLKPTVNLAALALAIYGYTLFFSALDIVHWRPTLLGSAITLAMFVSHMVVRLPSMEDWKWIDKYSIFNAYEPIELVTKGQTFAENVGYLTAIGVVGIVLAFAAFAYRDLPANS